MSAARLCPCNKGGAPLGKTMKSISSILTDRSLRFFVFGLCLVVTVPAQAQQAHNPGTSQDEINKQLLQRLQDLEKEVKQLKAQAAAPPVAPAAAPEPPRAVEALAVNEIAPRLKLNFSATWELSCTTTAPIHFYSARLTCS